MKTYFMGASLEAPCQGASNEYLNMFLWRNKKNISIQLKNVPALSRAVGIVEYSDSHYLE